MKDKALERPLWRTRCGRGCWRVVTQTTELKGSFLFLFQQILTDFLRRGHYPFLPHSLQFSEHLPSYFGPRCVCVCMCVTEIAVNQLGITKLKTSYI